MLKSVTHLNLSSQELISKSKMEYPHSFFMFKVLNQVTYMISSLRGDSSLFMLRSIYFTKFQSLIRYGIIVWGGERQSVKVLNKKESCRQTF